MKTLQDLRNGQWLVPLVAGVLIIASWAVQHLGGGAGNAVISPRWWLDADLLAHSSGGQNHAQAQHFTVANALMLTAAVVAGYGIALKAYRSLRVKFIAIDLLVSIAAIGAIVIGNFWEAAAVTFLFSIGNALEVATLNKTRSALRELIAVAPDTAVVMRGGQQREVPAHTVKLGEIVLIKAGAKVPVDGIVTEGSGAIDQSPITGESIPVEKTQADQVFAGTISRGGFLHVRTTGAGADTTLARIIHRVEEAQDAKAKTHAFLDRFSAWYTPAVIGLALVVGVLTGNIVLALTLLVIGCPGALVISIPVAIVAGIGRSARNGILIKGGEFLETAARIDAVALDKTGTLTYGKPQLTDVIPLTSEFSAAEVLRIAAAAEAGSAHPLAQPILDAAREQGVTPTRLPRNVTPVPGQGITAEVDGQLVAVGNWPLVESLDPPVDPDASFAARAATRQLAGQGKTPMIVTGGSQILGVIGVADTVREEAHAMVTGLKRAGIKRVIMLTGDTDAVAHAVGSQVGIDEVFASLMPQDKLDIVARLQRHGLVVAMVGDGVNDAPALATADIGVAMGAAGSAVAVETADIALMADDLSRLPQAVGMARRTVRVMRQNIALALITVAVLLAGVFAGGVTMALGMLVHEGSVLLVIVNAMRLMRPV